MRKTYLSIAIILLSLFKRQFFAVLKYSYRRKAAAVLRKVAEGLRFDCGQIWSFASSRYICDLLRFSENSGSCRISGISWCGNLAKNLRSAGGSECSACAHSGGGMRSSAVQLTGRTTGWFAAARHSHLVEGCDAARRWSLIHLREWWSDADAARRHVVLSQGYY